MTGALLIQVCFLAALRHIDEWEERNKIEDVCRYNSISVADLPVGRYELDVLCGFRGLVITVREEVRMR